MESPPRYKWRGQEYFLLKDLVECFGPSLRARWGKVPEILRLTLTGENKEYFCEENDIYHRAPRLALLLDTDQAWFYLVGIPRTQGALEACKNLKDTAFDFFWFRARQKEVKEKIKRLEKKRRREIKRLSRILSRLEKMEGL